MRRRRLTRTLVLAASLAALVLPARAAAQQPTQPPPAQPAQEQKPPPPPPDRWLAALDLNLSAARGNSRLTVLSTTLRIKHLETKSYALEWTATYRYGESRGDVVARNLNTALNLDVRPKATVSPFAFAKVEHDPFRRLDLRTNTGSGVMYSLYRSGTGTASVSLAGLYSHESFTTAQPERTDGRWSIRARVEQRLGAARIEHSAFYNPVWDHGTDFNVQALTKLSSRITQRLAMTFTHEYLHDSTPPNGVAREDQRFQAGATIELF